MDENTSTALYRSQVIDLTTTGRRTGRPRRIEIFLHEDGGRLFISGMPRADRTRTGSITSRLIRTSWSTLSSPSRRTSR